MDLSNMPPWQIILTLVLTILFGAKSQPIFGGILPQIFGKPAPPHTPATPTPLSSSATGLGAADLSQAVKDSLASVRSRIRAELDAMIASEVENASAKLQSATPKV